MTRPRLSILLPTRGRHELLQRAVASMLRDESMPDGTELLIGFDVDEPRILLPAAPGIRCFRRAQFPTLAQKVNALAASANGELMMNFPNDGIITAPDWPERVFAVVDAHPEPAIFYSFDGQDTGFTMLPLLRRQMVQEVGYYVFPMFPYWFTDTWWDEIAAMGVRKVGVDLGVKLNFDTGGTQGLRDVAFWAEFFERTRPQRIAVAERYSGRSPEPEIVAECARKLAHNRDPGFVKHYEAVAERIANPRYDEAKIAAEDYLRANQL